MSKASAATRVLASVPNFEAAYLCEEVKTDKPYNVLCNLKTDPACTILKTVTQLLDALINFTMSVPQGAVQWGSIDLLKQEVMKHETI